MPDVCKQLYDGATRTPLMRVEEACAWIADDYPAKWLRLVNLCEGAIAAGWPRISRDHLYSIAFMQGFPVTTCREFQFDHNLWSVLSRYLLMFRPELAGAIFPNNAEIDRAGIDFEAVWHEHVAGSTFFPAKCWQDAAKRYREAAA